MYQIAEAVRFGNAVSSPATASQRPAPVRLTRAASRAGEAATLLIIDALATGGAGALTAYLAAARLWAAAAPVLALAVALCARRRRSVPRPAAVLRPRRPAPHRGGCRRARRRGGCVAWLTGADPHGARRRRSGRPAGRGGARPGNRLSRAAPAPPPPARGGPRSSSAAAASRSARRGAARGPLLRVAPVGFIGPPTLTRPTVPVLAPATDLEKAVAKYKPVHLIVALPPLRRRARARAAAMSPPRRDRHVVPRLFELAPAVEPGASSRSVASRWPGCGRSRHSCGAGRSSG